jgi:molybdopterin-guanine dinucleotide biosynthesis protein A
MTRVGGVVLCGGRSSRMGRPKALLPFGDETLLQRVVRILSDIVQPIVVVAANGQELPSLPPSVRIVRDADEYAGPLAGMGAGLVALADEVDAAYVTACDVPLLKPEFVRAVMALLGDCDAAVPREDAYYHPLAGVYRTRLAPQIAALIAAGRMRPLYLIESVRSVPIDVNALRAFDGNLDSLRNLNTNEEYQAALRDSRVSAEPQPAADRSRSGQFASHTPCTDESSGAASDSLQ